MKYILIIIFLSTNIAITQANYTVTETNNQNEYQVSDGNNTITVNTGSNNSHLNANNNLIVDGDSYQQINRGDLSTTQIFYVRDSDWDIIFNKMKHSDQSNFNENNISLTNFNHSNTHEDVYHIDGPIISFDQDSTTYQFKSGEYMLNDDIITSKHISPGSIRNESMTYGSIDSRTIQDGSIEEWDLASDCVRSENIRDYSIKEIDLDNFSVSSAKIQNGSITPEKLDHRIHQRFLKLESNAAMQAALSMVNSGTPNKRFNLSVGIGNQDGSNAFAFGLNYKVNKKLSIKAASAKGTNAFSKNLNAAGFTLSF